MNESVELYDFSPELREKISKYIDWNRISEQQKTFIYYILENSRVVIR